MMQLHYRSVNGEVRYDVESLEKAARVTRTLIEGECIGSRDLLRADVYETGRGRVAKIHYNGRIEETAK